MPNLQFLLPLPSGLHLKSHGEGGGVFAFIPALEFWSRSATWEALHSFFPEPHQTPSHYTCFLSSLISLGLELLLLQ